MSAQNEREKFCNFAASSAVGSALCDKPPGISVHLTQASSSAQIWYIGSRSCWMMRSALRRRRKTSSLAHGERVMRHDTGLRRCVVSHLFLTRRGIDPFLVAGQSKMNSRPKFPTSRQHTLLRRHLLRYVPVSTAICEVSHSSETPSSCVKFRPSKRPMQRPLSGWPRRLLSSAQPRPA